MITNNDLETGQARPVNSKLIPNPLQQFGTFIDKEYIKSRNKVKTTYVRTANQMGVTRSRNPIYFYDTYCEWTTCFLKIATVP